MGERLERIGDFGPGDAKVSVATRDLNAHQSAVDEASEVRRQRGGGDSGFGGERARGQRPAVEQGHQHRRASGLAYQRGNRGNVGVSHWNGVFRHATDASSRTLRDRAKRLATRLTK